MRVRAIDFVAYHVKDVTASVAFYRDTLGVHRRHDGTAG